MVYDVIIVGAGASGLMCASLIKGSVLIIDKNDKIAKKVLASGGGKCNFTNLNMDPSFYFSCLSNKVEEILTNHTVSDILELLKKYKIKYIQKDNGKLFAENSVDIVNALHKECVNNKVEFLLNTEVIDIIKNEDGLFIVDIGKKLLTKNVVVASGGKSCSALGASDFGLRIAKKFKLKLIQNQPALVGLKYPIELKFLSELSGMSLNTIIKLNDKYFSGSLLFAHYGITGPVVFNTSLYINPGDELEINFIPLGKDSKLPKNFLRLFKSYYNLSSDKLFKFLSCFKFKYITSFGYDKAEVMRGGVDLSYLNSYLEHNRVSGLFFSGEVLDITGQLGGYNLHSAFATGKLVAKGINKILNSYFLSKE